MSTAPDRADGTAITAEPSGSATNVRLERWVARTNRPLDALALVFLAAIFVEWLFGDAAPNGWVVRIGNTVSWLVWFAFAVDYVARLFLSTDRGDFVKGHKLDLLMVLLPFLRIVRVVLILRKSVARISTDRIAESMLLIVGVLVSLGALIEWRLEYQAPDASITSIGRSFWWAVVTTTTVGYGDEYPVTIPGRIVAVLVMMVGIGLIGTVSATVASWFVSRRRTDDDEAAASADLVQTAAREADLAALHARLDEIAGEQTRIRELLEGLAPRAG